jgi:capsular polysaccharide biosynthesis protein
VNDSDRTFIFPITAGDEGQESPSGYDDFTPAEERPEPDLSMGLANLGFITAALKRSAWVWCFTALVGLVIGCGFYVEFPTAYGASTSLLLTNDPTEGPADAIATDVALAQSPAVAAQVIKNLGLSLSVTSFLASYTVVGVTNEVLTITVSAPSSSAAVSRANALATEFLRFRTSTLLSQQQLMIKAQEQEISQTQQNLSSINSQISSVDSRISAQPSSAALQGTLRSLRAQSDRVSGVLSALEASENTNQASLQSTTASVIAGSEVLNSGTPLHHSRLKAAIQYVGAGLIFGLALGMGIVVVRALASDRLRRRDDIAEALGAPVRLSVGAVRARRWLPRIRRGAATRGPAMKRVIAHLRRAVPESPRDRQTPASLAVVAVDNEPVTTRAVVALAASYASQGRKVVVADLSDGTRAARLLGAKKPGVHEVSMNGSHLVLAVPDCNDIAPIGSLRGGTPQARHDQPNEALMAACASADLLLTVITLDPADGGDHLATWATDAVVMVTAGRSSIARVHAVGEMIRLAGTHLTSAVLIDADKSDESLGMTGADDQSSVAGPPLLA